MSHVASARQHSGEPSSGLGPNGGRNDRLRGPDLARLDCEIAGLVDRSTQELRRAWRTLHHTGPPLGLSRDLIIRGLADKLQERAHGGPSRTLQRRLQILAGEFEKGARSLQNRIYRGEIVHNQQSYLGEHEPIVIQPLWDAVQAQLAGNAAQRNEGGKTRQPSLLAGVLFDGDDNRMTPSHAVKKGTRYRYYVSRSLITKDGTKGSAELRIPAAEIEHLVSRQQGFGLTAVFVVIAVIVAIAAVAVTQIGPEAKARPRRDRPTDRVRGRSIDA